MKREQGCYLIHFSEPYKHAGHYLGWSRDVWERLSQHEAGTGARLTQVARGAGIRFTLARIWPSARSFERQLKRQKNGRRLCPICNAPDLPEIPF